MLEPEIFDYIDGDETHFEKEPLERLARDGQLMAYRHTSFWQCMDTIRERNTSRIALAERQCHLGKSTVERIEPIDAGTADRARGIYWDSHEPRVVGAGT